MKVAIYGAGLFGDVFYRVISKYEKIDFFDRWVKFRENFNMEYYPSPTNSLDEQYFIEEFKYSKRFVDCGGFIGDTIESYYKHNIGGGNDKF